MRGPVLTMPSGFDTDSALLRSHSSDVLSLTRVGYDVSTSRRDDELPRSASYSSVPTLDSPPYDAKEPLHRVASADAAPKPSQGHYDIESGRGGERSSREDSSKFEGLGRRKSLVARPKSWIQRVRGSPERGGSREPANPTPGDTLAVPPTSKPARDKSRTASGSFATLARKSWISSSRSPSPSRATEKVADGGDQRRSSLKTTPNRRSSSPRKSLTSLPQPDNGAPGSRSPPKPISRTASTLQKIKRRPQSVLMTLTTFNSANSSATSLPRSSFENRSTPRTSTDRVPPVPSLTTLKNSIPEAPRKRDELWSSFRSLDNDFSKFQSKSWSLKTNVVRATILPFLRNHASRPLSKDLRPEDLDRRVTVLNKWWIGLLEVLDGKPNQTVSGIDRPVLLETTMAIMMRPEWRASPSEFAPLFERSPSHSPERSSLQREGSTGSLDSSNSQFVTESVYHNTRNLFIQNLLTQMRFVVDKMSLRHAPASLVTFCGKAAAYAFFFVPGVADILVRLWKVPVEALKRTADELGLPKRISKANTCEVATAFPSHIRSLSWTTAKSMAAQLQKRPLLTVLAGRVPWSGPWVARWRGRDSDLFFVFTKYYHILAEEFLPPMLPLAGKAQAPGFVLVQAQLLTALDATIHRQPPAEPLPITFDDVLAGADASATALPLPSSNSARLMAENRLIALLRDFISERTPEYDQARLTFGESFGKLVQAAARRTSLFNHNACFILCDFMEEALVIFVRLQLSRDLEHDFIDWYFWLDVCKKMLESQNTMSEIRLFALLYGIWGVITNNQRRKEVICLDWLLAEGTFNKYFNHWCPMVRAYYMRLLCWRLCRDFGEPTDLDTKIYLTAFSRLKSTWTQYLSLRYASDLGHTLPPSTAPCNPAPGRRLLILRNDDQPPSSNLFFGFDGIVPSSSATAQHSPNQRHSSAASPGLGAGEDSVPTLTVDSPTETSKRRWSFMGKILPSPFTTSDGSSTSPTKTLEEARRETALARTRPGHIKTPSSDSETPPSTSTHRVYSFRFSLEWAQHFDRPQNVPVSGPPAREGSHTGYDHRLSPPRLPAPAHSLLGGKVPGTSLEAMSKTPPDSPRGSEEVAQAKYTGRALAEWSLIVRECNNFVERRRAEGVPALRWVEIPALGVEGFRRYA